MKRLAILCSLVLARIAHADDEPAKPAEPPAVPAPAPGEPAKPTEPAKPAEPAKPTEPAKPGEPTTPAAPTAPTADPQKVTMVLANGMLQRHGISPDFTITGGVRLYHNETADSRWWFGRVRAGVLIYGEPTFVSLGVAGQFGPLHSAALGFEARLFNLWSGVWGQGGVFPIDDAGGVTMEASLGYGLFGLDYERRVSGARRGDQTLCLNVEVPLGLLRVVLKDPEGVIHLPKSSTARR